MGRRIWYFGRRGTIHRIVHFGLFPWYLRVSLDWGFCGSSIGRGIVRSEGLEASFRKSRLVSLQSENVLRIV